MPNKFTCSLILCASLFSQIACAGEFRNVGNNPVTMYDAPAVKGGKLYVAPRGMPVEVVFSNGAWSKVKDVTGDLSWVETQELQSAKNVIVRVANARVRATAEESAALVFTADKFVLLEFVEPGPSGWSKVKHRDGQTGYVRNNEIWGR